LQNCIGISEGSIHAGLTRPDKILDVFLILAKPDVIRLAFSFPGSRSWHCMEYRARKINANFTTGFV